MQTDSVTITLSVDEAEAVTFLAGQCLYGSPLSYLFSDLCDAGIRENAYIRKGEAIDLVKRPDLTA